MRSHTFLIFSGIAAVYVTLGGIAPPVLARGPDEGMYGGLAAVIGEGRREGAPPPPVPMPAEERAKRTIRGHQVTVYGGSWKGGFIVRKGGKEIYRQTGEEGFVIHADPDVDQKPLPETADLFGDGTPVLMMGSWTGGVHCCYRFYFFALEPVFHLVQTIDAGHSGNSSHLEYREKRWLLRIRDWTFAYWDTGFADSPAPEVILRFDQGAFRPALDLMAKPMPDLTNAKRVVNDPEQWRPGEPRAVPPVILETTLLELLYTGHAAEAWHFQEDAWPKDMPRRAEWLVSFKEQLGKSPWWPVVRAWKK